MYPTVTVWQGGQLHQVVSLPQFNATSGGDVQSIQITNNSDIALIFKAEKAAAVTILPRYRLTSPVDPNSQYNISMAGSQVGSSATNQYVTITEAPDAASFSLEPLTISVDVARLRLIDVITTNPPGSTGGITDPFSLLPSEQSLVIYCTFVQGGHTAFATISQGDIQGITVNFTSTDSWVRVPAFGMMSGSSPTWQVQYSCDSVIQPSNLYIFASADPPPLFGPDYNSPLRAQITAPLGQKTAALSVSTTPPSDLPVGRAGQLAKASSMPVTPPSDLPVGKTGQQTAANSMPVVPPSDLPIGATGQQVMASSLPVVMASDQGVKAAATVLAATPRTAAAASAYQTTNGYNGGIFQLNVTANPGGTESLALFIQTANAAGSPISVISFGTLITAANGLRTVAVMPGATAADLTTGTSITVAKIAALPSIFRVLVNPSGSGSWTYSVDFIPASPLM